MTCQGVRADHMRDAPSARRNRGPILQVLEQWAPREGVALEIAAGTGQHAVHFSAALPGLRWQPSDINPAALVSIAAWQQAEGTANLLPPVQLDVTSEQWPIDRADLVVCINMIHISPWAATEGLMRGAARLLSNEGTLFLYGPYHVGGKPTAPSNASFDAHLRTRDPRWGVRHIEDVQAEAAANGLVKASMISMPANNFSVIFKRSH